MNIQCQKCKSSCLRQDEIINGKCKYCGHDLFTVCLEDKTESGVELPCSGVLSDLRTHFVGCELRDIKSKVDWRIEAYEKGESALTAEQYDDYKHDAYLLFKAVGR